MHRGKVVFRMALQLAPQYQGSMVRHLPSEQGTQEEQKGGNSLVDMTASHRPENTGVSGLFEKKE